LNIENAPLRGEQAKGTNVVPASLVIFAPANKEVVTASEEKGIHLRKPKKKKPRRVPPGGKPRVIQAELGRLQLETREPPQKERGVRGYRTHRGGGCPKKKKG